MGFSEVPLKCDFNRLTEKHLAISIVLVPSHCHETGTDASATRATSTQDKAPTATDKQTVKSYASAFGWKHSTTFSPVRKLKAEEAVTSPNATAAQGDQKTKVQTVAVQAAKPKAACSTEAGRGGPMRRERNNAKPYMPARSIPPAEPDQDEKQRRTKSLLRKYRVEIFRTERPESDTVALTDDARWRNEEALQAYGMQFGRVLDCCTVNIRPSVGGKHGTEKCYACVRVLPELARCLLFSSAFSARSNSSSRTPFISFRLCVPQHADLRDEFRRPR